MTAALLFIAFAAVVFILWMAIGSRWLIWVFVFATLVLAIDVTHTGIPNTSLLPIALNSGG